MSDSKKLTLTYSDVGAARVGEWCQFGFFDSVTEALKALAAIVAEVEKAYNDNVQKLPNRIVNRFDLDLSVTTTDCTGRRMQFAFQQNLRVPVAELNSLYPVVEKIFATCKAAIPQHDFDDELEKPYRLMVHVVTTANAFDRNFVTRPKGGRH